MNDLDPRSGTGLRSGAGSHVGSGLSFATGLRCVHCSRVSPLDDGIYICPACGGNHTVAYDLEAVRRAWSQDTLER